MHRAEAYPARLGAQPTKESAMGAISDKIKGKAKQVEGRVTGDRVREMQGVAEVVKGDAKQAKGDIQGAVDRAVTRVRAGVTRTKAKLQRGASKVRAPSGARGRSR
jgi:uncharacterized protein YjbJ (UPF0337 family)